jgi:hypothetical protein
MFQQLDPKELHYNRKYKIEGTYDYSGIYMGKIWIGNQDYLQFDDCHAMHLIARSTKYFLPSRHYYEFVSKKVIIQSDMERRAVNLIVQRLIGDDYFKW